MRARGATLYPLTHSRLEMRGCTKHTIPIGSKRKKRDFGEEILSETDPTMTGGETLGGLSSKAPPTPADEVFLVLRSATIPGIRVKRGPDWDQGDTGALPPCHSTPIPNDLLCTNQLLG